MRTIKFRGQRKDNKEWVYGAYFCLHHEDGRTHVHYFIIPENTPIPKDKPIGEIQVEVIPETVGQFIGLVDKNGVEIYEGDTIKSHYANAVKSEHTETIVFYSGSFRAECKIGETGRSLSLLPDGIPHLSQDKSVYMEYFEIIGNIHERSEA